MGIGIYSTPLSARQQEDYLKLLEACGLRDEGDADIVALMTEDDRLIACGALAGHTVKQLAVDSEAEGQGAMAAVLSALIAEAYASGVHRLFLCTKPENLSMFRSMGFHTVIETKDAVLLENRKGGLDGFLESIPINSCHPHALVYFTFFIALITSYTYVYHFCYHICLTLVSAVQQNISVT